MQVCFLFVLFFKTYKIYIILPTLVIRELKCGSEIFFIHELKRKPARLNNRVVYHFYQLIRAYPSNRNLFTYKL